MQNGRLDCQDMRLAEIKRAVDEGLRVFWKNRSYEVIKAAGSNDYFIRCAATGHSICLTHTNGDALNGEETDFFADPL